MPESDDAGGPASVDQLRQELAAARSAEQAVGEILKIIGRSPENLDELFDTVLANALRLCEAELGVLFLYDPAAGWRAAQLRGVPERFADWLQQAPLKAAPATGLGRLELHHKTLNIADVRGEDVYRQGDPLRTATVELGGARSFAAIPMLAGDTLKGALTIYRQQVRPFNEHHIGLVDRFADQAVIALENTRRVNEIRSLSRASSPS